MFAFQWLRSFTDYVVQRDAGQLELQPDIETGRPASDRSSPIPTLADEATRVASISIFHVPTYVKRGNTDNYHPQMVSIGPYHHGCEDLKLMETHKRRAFKKFLHFEGRHKKEYKDKLKERIEEIRNAYENLDLVWQNDEEGFLMMMLVDGCFMLELFRNREGRYAENDPVFGVRAKHTVIPMIKKDLLMLENQIPTLVLKLISEVATGLMQETNAIDELILKFFDAPKLPAEEHNPGLHVLNVVRLRILLGCDLQPLLPRTTDENIQYSITELQEMDVKVQAVPENGVKHCLRYISFEEGVLSLPCIVVDRNFQSFFLNMMAFECLIGLTGYDVCAYLSLMTSLIRSEKDVRFLQSHQIIDSELCSEKQILEIFEELSKFHPVHINSSRAYTVRQELSDHCKRIKKRRERWLDSSWKALKDSYWANIWTKTSLFVGAIFLTTTIVSTLFGVKTFYKKITGS